MQRHLGLPAELQEEATQYSGQEWSLGSDRLEFVPWPCLTSCMTLDKFLTFPEAHFPHL